MDTFIVYGVDIAGISVLLGSYPSLDGAKMQAHHRQKQADQHADTEAVCQLFIVKDVAGKVLHVTRPDLLNKLPEEAMRSAFPRSFRTA